MGRFKPISGHLSQVLNGESAVVFERRAEKVVQLLKQCLLLAFILHGWLTIGTSLYI